MKKRLLTLILISMSLLTSCGNKNTSEVDQTKGTPIVNFLLSTGVTVQCELYPSVAPITVNNFIKYVESGFYDGTVFHRVIENFMIQAGGYYVEEKTIFTLDDKLPPIYGEFTANGFQNDLKHVPGTLSMARTLFPDSATSQFFICVAECTWLDGQYAAFGKVINEEGLNQIIEFSKVPTYDAGSGLTDFPFSPMYIDRAYMTYSESK